MKKYKKGDSVTISNDRSSNIDDTVVLDKHRLDLDQKWHKLDGLDYEVWEALRGEERVLVARDTYNNVKAEFILQPDFDNDLNSNL